MRRDITELLDGNGTPGHRTTAIEVFGDSRTGHVGLKDRTKKNEDDVAGIARFLRDIRLLLIGGLAVYIGKTLGLAKLLGYLATLLLG